MSQPTVPHYSGIKATVRVINGFAAVDFTLKTDGIMTGHGELKLPGGATGLAAGNLYQSSPSETIGTTTAMYVDIIDRVVTLTFFNEDSGNITGAFVGAFGVEFQDGGNITGRVGRFKFSL